MILARAAADLAAGEPHKVAELIPDLARARLLTVNLAERAATAFLDTGDTPGAHVQPSATLTLHMPKPGLANPVAGRLYVADLGIPAGVTGRIGVEPPLYGPAFVVPIVREPEGAEVAEEVEIPECREGS